MSFDPTDFSFGANTAPKRDRKAEWQKRKHKVYLQACEIRDRLRKELGNECNECGAKDSDENHLCFNHLEPRDWEPNKKNLLQRMKLYERDYKARKINLLCNECNGFDGGWYGLQRKLKKKLSSG